MHSERELLRHGVEGAFVALAQGLLAHRENLALRAALAGGSLTAKDFAAALHRLLFRLIVLLIVEERGLLPLPGASETARRLYVERHGVGRLRDRAAEPAAGNSDSDDWEGIKVALFGLGRGDPRLGLPALGGLFERARASLLDEAKLESRALLQALSHLCWRREAAGLVPVTWRDRAPEELGCVYESLLELPAQISNEGGSFAFALAGETKAHTRRSTGSYYTPDKLVQVLLARALEPVLERAVSGAGDPASDARDPMRDASDPARAVEALLELTIVDPACGAGHFLLAAARRIARHVARIRAGGTPPADEYRHALREVVHRCVYGVDRDPMAVELCRVSLWLEVLEPGLPLTFLDSHIQQGNALLGASPALMARGVPDAAWRPCGGDDRTTASALKRRNQRASESSASAATAELPWHARQVRAPGSCQERSPGPTRGSSPSRTGDAGDAHHQKLVADAWCAAFFWPKQPGPLADGAPTNARWRSIRDRQAEPSPEARHAIEGLAAEYQFFHWHLAFAPIFEQGGFDVVLGNPPWIAHAGRAAQPLPDPVKTFCAYVFESFAGYPTTHGMFVLAAARLLRPGGQLGLVIPSSLSELEGYEPTRRAHDRLCCFPGELVDFGEGQFDRVTQPCMALVSRRVAEGRSDAPPGSPWPVERPDLDAQARRLLTELGAAPRLPAELFGERGVQSDRTLAVHFRKAAEPDGRFSTPIREGTDVREFELRAPRLHVDREGLGARIRATDEFRAVRIVIRQTARYPIAARSDGGAFRNSLLAAFESPEWPADALVALLNSALVRWLHYQRFRDARQPVMPQVKIGHLHAIPAPRDSSPELRAALAALGERLSLRNRGLTAEERAELDELVGDLYRLDTAARELVRGWHEARGPAVASP